MFTFTSELGVPFNVRIVRKGDRYGRNDCLVHDSLCPLVEFYDARYAFTDRGQFVSCYYADTIVKRHEDCGLILDGGNRGWDVDPKSMKEVVNYLHKNLEN